MSDSEESYYRNQTLYTAEDAQFEEYDPQQFAAEDDQVFMHNDQPYVDDQLRYELPAGYDGAQQDQIFGGQPVYDGATTEGDYSTSIPDVLLLNHCCASAHPPRDSSEEAKLEADLSWEPVREWLRTHSAEEVREGAQQRGDSAMTALHVACRNVPPSDVIDVLLSIAGDTAQWQDSFGWLPIHYACACGADAKVIKSLADAFPESKTTVDRRGRTPLHFALGNSNPDNPVSPAVVVLLSSTGAASLADDSGMLVCKKIMSAIMTAVQ